MKNLTIFLIVVFVVLVYVIYTHREYITGSDNLCANNKIQEYQTNEVNYEGADVESKYFNQLMRSSENNEHKLWLENQKLEEQMQKTHQCQL